MTGPSAPPLSVDRGAQQDRVTGGSVLVADAMVAALGERIVLGRPVRRIEHGRVTVG